MNIRTYTYVCIFLLCVCIVNVTVNLELHLAMYDVFPTLQLALFHVANSSLAINKFIVR